MEKIVLFGGGGQHGQDLITRGIFSNFHVVTKNHGDSFEKSFVNGVVVNISQTRRVIEYIIENNSSSEIINFSGIMGTNPDNEDIQMSNLHFMFGPGRIENLHVLSAGNITPAVSNIITKAQEKGIKHKRVSQEYHDSRVAITQATTHLFIVLSGFSDNKILLKDWRAPENTITQMLFENKIFLGLVPDILEMLQLYSSLSEVLQKLINSLSDTDLELFATPNFLNVRNFFKENDIYINEEMVTFVSLLSQESFQKRVKVLKSNKIDK